MRDGAAPAAGSSPLPAGMVPRGGRGLAAEGKEARAGKSGLFLAAVSVLTLDNPVPQFTTAQQPACSGGRRRAASPGWEQSHPQIRSRGAAGEGDESLLHFSLPSRATLAGKGKRCPHPPELPQALPQDERRNPNAGKSLPIPDQGGTLSQPCSPPRTRFPSPKGNFQPLGRGSAAPAARLPELAQLQPLPSGRSRPSPPSACGGRMRRVPPAPPGSGG